MYLVSEHACRFPGRCLTWTRTLTSRASSRPRSMSLRALPNGAVRSRFQVRCCQINIECVKILTIFLFEKGTLLYLPIYLCILYSLVVSLFLYCGLFCWSCLFLSGLMQSLGRALNGIKSKMCATKISEQRKNTNQKCFSLFQENQASNESLKNVDDSLRVLQWCARKGLLPRTRRAPVIRMSQFRLTFVNITVTINPCLTSIGG